jgi:Zn-dependent protease
VNWSFRIGPILGVRVRIQPVWLLATALLVVAIQSVGVPDSPQLSPGIGWLLGILAGLILVVSVIAHELAHAIMARRLGVTIEEVGLFMTGDRTQADQEALDGRGEVLISASGLMLSLVVGGMLVLAWYLVPPALDEPSILLRGLLWWGAVGNLVLGAMNLVPVHPFDGGRLARGALWWFTRDKSKATVMATRFARAFAWALVFAGLTWAFFTGDLFYGLWMVVGGVFLMQSSRFYFRRMEISRVVAGLTVGEVMDERFAVVGPNLTLDTLFAQYERSRDVETYPVTNEGTLLGSIDMDQIQRVPRAQWARTRVTDVMTAFEQLQTMTGRESVMDALLRFDRSRLDAIPVVDEKDRKQLVGILTRARLLEKLRPRVRRMAEQDQAAGTRP